MYTISHILAYKLNPGENIALNQCGCYVPIFPEAPVINEEICRVPSVRNKSLLKPGKMIGSCQIIHEITF